MKYAIISDIHDNLTNLEKCLRWCRENQIESLICCGDLTNPESLGILAHSFSRKIWLVRGNSDNYIDEDTTVYENLIYLGHYNRIEIGGRFYGICHEPYHAEELLNEFGPCEIIFYGHTHKPWIEKRETFEFVNPGTLGGVFNKATFAVWDPANGGIELKVLELL